MAEQPFIVDQAETLRRMVTPHDTHAVTLKPRIVSVMSGKGGVGKSTVALNTAFALAEAGTKVLLVDADPNLGNIDVMVGASPHYRLGHVLKGEIDIEDALFSPLPGLEILAGNSGDATYPPYDEHRFDRLFKGLVSTEERFDLVVVDSGAGLNRENLHSAVRSEEVLVVATVEPTAVLDVYAVIKMIVTSGAKASLSILMNQVRTPFEADQAAEKLIKAVNHFLAVNPCYKGFIPFDTNATTAVIDQRPLVQQFPYSAASLSLRRLSQGYSIERASQISGRRKVIA